MHNLFWALLVLVAVAALLRQDWIYFLVYLVGGLWVVSHWWVRRSLKHITVQRHMLDRAFAGETIDVRLEVANRSWLPLPWLQVQEQAPLDLKDAEDYRMALSVGSRARAEMRYRLACKRRGYYPLGPLMLTTGDLFGFATATWHEQTHPHVTVYPRIVPLHKLGLPSRSPFGALPSRQRIFADPSRMAGVRAYTTGDSLRHIHWKASAHEDTLLVKKFQPAIALHVTVVLDLNRNSYPPRGTIGYIEWAVVVAASVASYVAEQRQPVGLLTNGHDPVSAAPAASIPAHHGRGHLMDILGLLARIEGHPVEPELGVWLPGQITDLTWGGTLIVVTPWLDEASLWTLHDAYRRGANVVALVCAPQPTYANIRAQGERLGVAVHRTLWEADLKSLNT